MSNNKPFSFDEEAEAVQVPPVIQPKMKSRKKEAVEVDDEELPTAVHQAEQLERLPTECLSDDRVRPLRHVDDRGNVYHYALRPTIYSVALILLVEVLERFSFYGIYYTQTMYLTGVYNEDWNAGFTSVDAATFVSISTAVAYTTPFVGALLADNKLGDYQAIVFGAVCLYLPGLLLMALTTVPGLLGEDFNTTALLTAILFLWPMGTGIVKATVNVFGAKQFHPLLQSASIESYYVNFYTSINVGALAGITVLPVVAQQHVTVAYSIPCFMLGIGILVFVSGTPRYVISKPRGDIFHSNKKPAVPLRMILRVTLLIVPFCIAYSQMPTTFIVQGTVMTKAFGVVDAASMNSLDAVSVLVFGYLIGSHLYPALNRRGIKIPTTYKFAIGSCFGALSILWALWVESMIHHAYKQDERQISVLWQAPSYMLIGVGEIFAVSAAYEVAFTASSPETKALASATNIFCVGGIPNVLCIFLYQACQGWFRNQKGTSSIQHIEDYSTAHVANYFWVLVMVLLAGIFVNTLPSVRDFVDSLEKKAADLVKTPVLGRRVDEGTPLLRKKFGSRPVLYKLGSMRAGPSLSQKHLETHVKSKYIPKLYQAVTKQVRRQGGQASDRRNETTLSVE